MSEDPVKAACETYMEALREGASPEQLNECENAVFEAAMERNFSPEIWKEVNELIS